jgi:hypothetical protein
MRIGIMLVVMPMMMMLSRHLQIVARTTPSAVLVSAAATPSRRDAFVVLSPSSGDRCGALTANVVP